MRARNTSIGMPSRNQRRVLIAQAGWVGGATVLWPKGMLKPVNAHTPIKKHRTGWVYDDAYLTPVFEPSHPEQPARVAAISNAIKASLWHQHLRLLKPQGINEKVLDQAIGLIHNSGHINALRAHYSPAIVQLARLAVGGTLVAVDAVQTGRLENVFVCSRPPGHHARNTGREEGFCFFNHVSIAARYAQKIHRARRILIVDWDYHHGDGTEHFFYDDASVLVFNTYDPRAYPQVGDPTRTGSGAGIGFNINVPLTCGTTDAQIEQAFRQVLIPAANRFKPDLILISCGFDSRVNDPLGCFAITDDGYRALTRIVMNIARQHCNGRIVSILEGGYNLPGLADASVAHVSTLLEYRRTPEAR